MQERNWKVGGKYRLTDVAGFTEYGYPNKYIADKLGSSEFTVESLRDCCTGVKTLVEFPLEGLEWTHWFNDYEIKYFEEITEQDNTSAVVDWLDKYGYIQSKESHVGELQWDWKHQGSGIYISLVTDFGDVHGTSQVVEFINNRYSQLTEQANKAKREELLAEIVKAKNEYEKLVGELAELEEGL